MEDRSGLRICSAWEPSKRGILRAMEQPKIANTDETPIQPTEAVPEASPRNTLYVENISEAAAACLFTMVQGNILVLGLGHLYIATQTGIVAGLLATAALLVAKTSKRWVVSLVLGCVTAIVDFLIHPGMFGGVATEALVTGLMAGCLSYMVGSLIAYLRKKS